MAKQTKATTRPARGTAAAATKAKAALAEYRRKRNFVKTPEPSGEGSAKKAKKEPGLAFCVQKHLASHLHYDFRLEHNGVLLSWAVPKGPSLKPGDKRLAMRTEDHPFDYGDFEGVIPEGYGAGIVVLWDRGTWRPDAQTPDVDAAMAKGELKFELEGEKLKGSWVLVRTRGFGGRESWLLIKHRDRWAGDVDVTGVAPWSVKSGRDFAEILAEEDVSAWASHVPAKGGEAGRMLKQIVAEAARLKAAAEAKRPKRPTRVAAKKTTKKTTRR